MYIATLNICQRGKWGLKGGKRAVITNGAIMRGEPRWWIQFIPTDGFIYKDEYLISPVTDWMHTLLADDELSLMFRVGADSADFITPDGKKHMLYSREDQENFMLEVLEDPSITAMRIEWNCKLLFNSNTDITTNGHESMVAEICEATVYLLEATRFENDKTEVAPEELDDATKPFLVPKGESKGLSGVQNNLSRAKRKRAERKERHRAVKAGTVLDDDIASVAEAAESIIDMM
jgi:hypothetical protein